MSPRARLACLAVAGGAVLVSGAGVASASGASSVDQPAASGFLIPPAPGYEPGQCGTLGGSACYVLQWIDYAIDVLLPG